MKAAILGCGYVGATVAQRWRSQGMGITATTTRPERVPELESVADRVMVMQGSNATAMAELVREQDVVLMCVGAGRQADYRETYLNTAKALVQGLEQAPEVKQVIFTSTYSVYGDHGGAWVTEADSVKPATDRHQITAATEETLLAAGERDRAICIFRLGGIYGPGRDLAKIYRRAAGTTRPGDGQQASNWIHLHDIVGAIDFARQRSLRGVYNLVQDEILPVKALIDRVCQAHGLDPVQWDPSKPSTRLYNVRVSNQKLKAAGYQFSHPQFEI